MIARRVSAAWLLLGLIAATAAPAALAGPSEAAARNIEPSPCAGPPALGVRPGGRRCPAVRGASDLASLGGTLLGGAGGISSVASQAVAPAGALGQGLTGIASSTATNFALAAIGASVTGGATFVLHATAHILGETTTPRLDSAWFSGTYWRVAAIASVLTLPFLFAASVQALIRADLTLLVRAAFAYLPLAMLAVAIAAPLTMLLLSASDELATAVSSVAGHQGLSFLGRVAGPLAGLGGISGSPFLAFLVALFMVVGALVLWVELLMREAAVYVIVLMLPLVFAAFVWPARRIWAIRSVELLVALVLSKFAIVAVLSLGGAALGHSVNSSLAGVLAGAVLLTLGAFAPWALLRLLPLTELASGAAGALRGHAVSPLSMLGNAEDRAAQVQRWASSAANLRRTADAAEPPPAAEDRQADYSPDAAQATTAGVASVKPEGPTGGSEPAAPPQPATPHRTQDHDLSRSEWITESADVLALESQPAPEAPSGARSE